jgi:hypothetical protein
MIIVFMNSQIDWNDVIKKEARGLDDDNDLGEIKDVLENEVVTQVGILATEIYHIPKSLALEFDGDTLWFRISKDEANSKYKV